MTSLDELVALRDANAMTAAAWLGVDPESRERITGYGALHDVDVLDDPSGGVRVHLDGDAVVLVYVGATGLPEGVDHDRLVAFAGDEGVTLRSRMGKRATHHVVAQAGLAWSEEDGDVGFLEVFPPTNTDDYRRRIYAEPPAFRN